MNHLKHRSLLSVITLTLALLGQGCTSLPRTTVAHSTAPSTDTNAPLQFVIRFPESVRSDPVTGRVLLLLARKPTDDPRRQIDWFDFDPVFAIEVTNLPPGDAVVFTPDKFRQPDALAFPKPLGQLDSGTYYAQAVIDQDQTERDFATGPGNLYSKPKACFLNRGKGGTFELLADHIVQPETLQDTEWVKLVEIRSDLLSAFHGRDIKLKAAVILPSDYAKNTEQRFPAVYIVPGFGGRHTGAWRFINGRFGQKWKEGKWEYQALHVILDPDVPLGHSVFANSDNNGPVGDALVKELIPEIERRFRAIAKSQARVVSGHSSGGWASLWLQITYPEIFGGCWSTSPDPVDFRVFQTMNIYADRNGHWSPDGNPRGLGRTQHKMTQNFATMNHWEYVTGWGGQLDSFNAVFSRRGPDGKPMLLMDKLSGEIDPSVAQDWKRYDIRMVLEQDWEALRPKLGGKIHVLCGGWDTFYLDEAVRNLAAFLKGKDHGSYVEILPGDHGSVMTDAVRERIDKGIAELFQHAQD